MKELKGYVMVLGAAIFWGASATAAKFLLNHHIDTITIVQARVTFTALLLLPFLAVYRPAALRVPLHEIWRFFLAGIVGVAGSNFTYYFTIKESTVATGILIQYTAPLLVMGYAAWSGEERLTSVKVTAAIISLAGCFFAVGAYDPSVLKITPLGLLTGLASTASFAFLNIYTRTLLHRYSLWSVTFYSIVGASLFWFCIHPPWGMTPEEATGIPWLGLFGLAIVSILIPHTLYFSGLRYIVPSRAIITSTLEPIVAIGSAALMLGELLRGPQVLGAGLVIAAIILLQVRREPEPILRAHTGGEPDAAD
jgi:drug/metabolite transporter, DME family